MSAPDVVSILKEVMPYITSLSLPVIAYYIRKLEKNTNSIKDALVEVTGASEYAKGVLAGRSERLQIKKGD